MAESSFWEKHCESCLDYEERKQVKARTLCFECQECLCEECSNWHVRFKKSKGHHLIDLVPFTNKPASSQTNEDELASDFLEHLTISENTVLYSAQVAVENKDPKTLQSDGPAAPNQTDPSRLKGTKCLEFNIERPDDKAKLEVRGVVCFKDFVTVAVYGDNSVKMLRSFDRLGNFLSSTHVTEHIWGMTSVDNRTFATCGSDHKVSIWKMGDQSHVHEQKSYKVDPYMSQGIHFNDTYYCVLHVDYSAISILDKQGNGINKILLKEAFGKQIKFGWDIHMDKETNIIFVPCRQDNGLLSLSIQGQPLWFIPLDFPWGITEVHGTLLVADGTKRYFHLLSKSGNRIGRIPSDREICGQPRSVCYGQDNKLYQGFHGVDNNRNMIFAYSITFD